MKQLVVSAISKEVRLPENEVSLSAYTVPAEQPGKKDSVTYQKLIFASLAMTTLQIYYKDETNFVQYKFATSIWERLEFLLNILVRKGI